MRLEPAGPEREPRAITAELFGGRFQGGGWVTLALPEFSVNGTLADVDLSRLAQEVARGGGIFAERSRRRSTCTAAGGSINGLGGRGRVHLSEADIYELPVMISMLKLLSIREPNTRRSSPVISFSASKARTSTSTR